MQEGSANGYDATTAPTRWWQAPRALAEAMGAELGPAELAIDATANQGRWVVECPDCCGAQLATREDPRFMCNVCANVAVGGFWRPVTWPADVAAITDVLDQRPVVNQNWQPTETLESLQDENEIFLATAGEL